MNREHLKAFLWLRWRLRVNQFRKAGALNAVLFFAFVIATLSAAAGLLIAGFLVGLLVMPEASPVVHLLVWDGIIGGFLFFWMIGLLTDLQRSEGLALDKVMHLPVSPSGAFLINYVSTLFSLTMIAFLPGMLGLILGQVCAGSVAMLLALPLLVTFVLAVTGVTYQFQGWLASLMTNPRRRRTVIVIVTTGFVLLAQVPNLINVARPWNGSTQNDALTRWNEQRAEASADLATKKITREEYNQREVAFQKEFMDRQGDQARHGLEQTEHVARLVSLVLPPGWMALGVSGLAAGGVVPALLATLGLGLIGAVSLRRAYRTTIRLYTGAFTGHEHRSAPTPAPPVDPSRVRLLERRVPWVSEYASAVALAAFRSITRAPEAKMVLLSPVIMLVVLAGGTMSAKAEPPPAFRPLMVLGAGVMVLFICGAQLIGNQFAYDRAGFRAYVLSPIPRREILLGKNLAIAPFCAAMGLFLMVLVGIIYPMRIDHYPAAVAQLISAYLLFCMIANAMSILAPIPITAGSMQPARVKMIPMLIHMALMAVLPFMLIPVVIPIGAEALLAEFADVRGWPVSLGLSLLVLAGTVFVYRAVLTWEGRWLAARERTILDVVANTKE